MRGRRVATVIAAAILAFAGAGVSTGLAQTPNGNVPPYVSGVATLTSSKALTIYPLVGQSSCLLGVTGTWSGTLTVSVASTNGNATAIKDVISGASSISANGNYAYETYSAPQLQVTSPASGSANVTYACSLAVARAQSSGGGGTVSTVTGTNPIVVTSPSPGTVNVAVSPNPIFSGNAVAAAWAGPTNSTDTGLFFDTVNGAPSDGDFYLSGDTQGKILIDYDQEGAGVFSPVTWLFDQPICLGDKTNTGPNEPAFCFDSEGDARALYGFPANGGSGGTVLQYDPTLANYFSFPDVPLVANAALTPSPAPTGYYGPAVVAQATAAPTMQPGTIDVATVIVGPNATQTPYPVGVAFPSTFSGDMAAIGTSATGSGGVTGQFFSVSAINSATHAVTQQLAAIDESANFGILGAFKANGSVIGGQVTAPTCTSGDGCFSRSATAGAISLGGGSSSCLLDYNVTVSAFATFGCGLRTNAEIMAGAWASGAVCATGYLCSGTSSTGGGLTLGSTGSHCSLDYGVTTASVMTFGCPVKAVSINGLKPSVVSCTDSSVGAISCTATVAYTSQTSYSCGMSYVPSTTTTGTATGMTTVNTSSTSVTGTVVGLSVATGTATILFNCLGT